MCSRLWQWGESILEASLRLGMQGKKGCVSLEQNTIHLNLASYTGARLGGPGPAGVGFAVYHRGILGYYLTACSKWSTFDFTYITSISSSPFQHFWELGQWRWHRALGIYLIGINCVTRSSKWTFQAAFFYGKVGKFSKLLADFARGLFFPLCEVFSMKSYLWNRELELGLPFGGKAQLCTQEVSQGKYWTQAMSKKATKCLQQQTASFAATMWHSKVGSPHAHGSAPTTNTLNINGG